MQYWKSQHIELLLTSSALIRRVLSIMTLEKSPFHTKFLLPFKWGQQVIVTTEVFVLRPFLLNYLYFNFLHMGSTLGSISFRCLLKFFIFTLRYHF